MDDNDFKPLIDREHVEASMNAVINEIKVLSEKVTDLDHSVDRNLGGIREEMRRGFADTQALLKSFQRSDDSTG